MTDNAAYGKSNNTRDQEYFMFKSIAAAALAALLIAVPAYATEPEPISPTPILEPGTPLPPAPEGEYELAPLGDPIKLPPAPEGEFMFPESGGDPIELPPLLEEDAPAEVVDEWAPCEYELAMMSDSDYAGVEWPADFLACLPVDAPAAKATLSPAAASKPGIPSTGV